MNRTLQFARACVMLLVVALSVEARADGIDDFNNSWAGLALASQRELDRDTPVADLNIIGTHNSYNSSAYTTATSYLIPNQVDSIYNQLRMGVRAIELDVHWTPKTEGLFSFPDRLLLCHGTAGHIGCSLDDRYFTEGLDEIAAWLNSTASLGQVLILYIEDHMDGQYGEAYSQVSARIGNWVYASGGCGDVPGSLSKADVLAAGKNVVIWNDGGCTADANWNATVFTGLGGISRVWEDSTTAGGSPGSGAAINDNDVINYFAGGTNVVALDQLHQNDSRWVAAIWSWDTNEPNDFGGNEDCVMQSGNGRWNDAVCDNLAVFACQHVGNGSWAVSPSADAWGLGGLACAGLGADYRFGVATYSQDNQSLQLAKQAAGQSVVWLNRDDRVTEGVFTTTFSEDVFYAPGTLSLLEGQSVSGKTRRLTMELDCNLVLRSQQEGIVGGGLWSSATTNAGAQCVTHFQLDGNLVLYDGIGQPLWSSSTSGAELRIQADGNLVIYDGAANALWQSFTNYASEYSLAAGQFALSSGQVLHSQNRKLEMRPDCDLVLFSFENGVTGGVLWHSDTAGAGSNCVADFQSDGNLVVYDGGGQPQWNAGTSGTSGAELRLQADGNLVVYNGAGQPLWTANANVPSESVFTAGQLGLSTGQFVYSQNRRLEMQPDCNLVLTSFENAALGGVMWHSDTSNAGTGCQADFQADGNLVVYNGVGQSLWSSGTSGTTGAELRLQSDGNLVVYNGAGQPLWSTNTNIPSQLIYGAGQVTLASGQFLQSRYRRLEMQPDCNLVVYNVTNALPNDAVWHSDTTGAGSDCAMDFQADGNLVVYDGFGQFVWATGTSGTTAAELWLQDDGNVVLYNDVGTPLWQSNTPGLFVAGASCGDLSCDGAETCSSCPGDCGSCSPVCGDGSCDGGETCSSCQADCGSCGGGGAAVPSMTGWGAAVLITLLPSIGLLLVGVNRRVAPRR